ncbi:apolipoprotein N-acyltransferase [Nocardioides lentus]|uniref:Apolipoprotein N-acyltransferase n=1 Tax=Nocardioides lentus TaxID=338077 RepID=A0ABN2P4B0_9ACTN
MLVSAVLALASGLLLAGAFEPVGVAALAPLGVAGAVLAVHRLRERRAIAAFVPGLLTGLGFLLPLWSWLGEIGPDAWIAVSILEASFYGAWAVAAVLLMRLRAWPLWVAAAWLATESVRGSWPFGGFPWGRLAFATADTPYAAGMAWWGANGVSLLVALTGVLGAWAVLVVRAHPGRVGAAAAGLVAVVALPVVAPYDAAPDGSAGTARIAAVQGDVPGPGNDVLYDSLQLTENHAEATEALAADVAAGRTPAPDLVVWPENSTTVDPFATSGLGLAVGQGIDRAVEAVGVPVLVGAIVDAPEEGRVLNQGIVYTPGVGAGQRYTKRHPVPFGEFIPFRDASWFSALSAQIERLDLVPRDMLAGTRSEPLDVGGVAVADAICFDVAYDDGVLAQVDAGAEVLVVQTSNALFIDTPQIDQQFEITRLRAMESGRTAVVAAINGVSGVIGPDGEVRQSADPRTRAVLEADVVLADSAPPSVLVGPWLGRAATTLAVLALLLALALPRLPVTARARLGSAPYRRSSGAPPHEGAAQPAEEGP